MFGRSSATRSPSRDGKTELQTLVEKSRELMPAGQDLPTDIRMPDSMTFREANARDVFTALGQDRRA